MSTPESDCTRLDCVIDECECGVAKCLHPSMQRPAASRLSDLEFDPEDHPAFNPGSPSEPEWTKGLNPEFDPSDYERPVTPAPKSEVFVEPRSMHVSVHFKKSDSHGTFWRATAEITATLGDGSVYESLEGEPGDTPKEAWTRLSLALGRRLRVFR